jgi:hypothetical protein
MTWKVEEQEEMNDRAQLDVWWNVTNGDMMFKSANQDNANWLAHMLNQLAA